RAPWFQVRGNACSRAFALENRAIPRPARCPGAPGSGGCDGRGSRHAGVMAGRAPTGLLCHADAPILMLDDRVLQKLAWLMAVAGTALCGCGENGSSEGSRDGAGGGG